MTTAQADRARRRIGFQAWAACLVVVFGIGSFEFILTFGLLSQLRAPERKIAAMQQAALVIPALLIGSALAHDAQNVIPALVLVPALGILFALDPVRDEFLKGGSSPSLALLTLALAGGIPLIAYALDMAAQARRLAGPPHHVQRLSTMAALAIAILLVGLLAALRTRGWRVPA